MKCAKNALAQSLNNLNGFVLFLDNPPAQETDKFKNAIAGRNDVAWFGLENARHIWQVANAGLRKCSMFQLQGSNNFG